MGALCGVRPVQGSIDRCRALVYDFVRRSRDADTVRKQANFRNLAKAQLVKMQQLEKSAPAYSSTHWADL